MPAVPVFKLRVNLLLVEVPEENMASSLLADGNAGKQADAQRGIRAEAQSFDWPVFERVSEPQQRLVVEQVQHHNRTVFKSDGNDVNNRTLLDACDSRSCLRLSEVKFKHLLWGHDIPELKLRSARKYEFVQVGAGVHEVIWVRVVVVADGDLLCDGPRLSVEHDELTSLGEGKDEVADAQELDDLLRVASDFKHFVHFLPADD